MNMLIKTYRYLLADIVVKSGVHLDVPDEMTLNWLLIEAPKLDKIVLRCIEEGETERPSIPEWLMPLWDAFIAHRDPCFLRYLRMCLVFCYKAEIPCSDACNEQALSQFIETDLSIEVWNQAFAGKELEPLFREARRLIGAIIYRADWSNITPRHGPGAVFPRSAPSAKSNFDTIYSSIQQLYPFDQFFCGIPSFWWDVMVDRSAAISEKDDIVCNLTMVPKDSRGPRIICVHPKEAMWIQQGQRNVLERCITHNCLTSGRINFRDQTVNGRMALEASRTKEFVTLDLKEASDRMSNRLVEFLFGGAFPFLNASRATHVVGQGIVGKHELRKFAPMGNGLTFPVQSLVFWALVRSGIRCHYGEYCDDVYVFGDDIIYPSKYHTGALSALVRAGFVPNMNKTFRLGSFRESCGVDAYGGIDITPYRMKACDVESYSNCVSLCDLAKRLRLQGYEQSSSFIYSRVRQAMGLLHLSNNPDAQGIYEYVCDARSVWLHERVVYNADVQVWQTKLALVVPSLEADLRHDWYHVQDSLLKLAQARGYSERGLEYTVPYSERLVNGWTEVILY